MPHQQSRNRLVLSIPPFTQGSGVIGSPLAVCECELGPERSDLLVQFLDPGMREFETAVPGFFAGTSFRCNGARAHGPVLGAEAADLLGEVGLVVEPGP